MRRAVVTMVTVVAAAFPTAAGATIAVSEGSTQLPSGAAQLELDSPAVYRCGTGRLRWFYKCPEIDPYSVWRRDISAAPLDPNNARLIANWNSMDSGGINLGGFDGLKWSWAKYKGRETDPIWDVLVDGTHYRFHGDRGAQYAPGDNEITIVDISTDLSGDSGRGIMYQFGSIKSWNNATLTGTANYVSISYLKSNGLDGRAVGHDESRNSGHRGLSCMTFGWDGHEVRDTLQMGHLIRLGIKHTTGHIWPYTGDEGIHEDSIIPEGAIVRLKASFDISKLTNVYVQRMALALKTYGAVIADQTSGRMDMKLQQPWDWASMGINGQSLAAIHPSDFEFIKFEWGKPRP